MWIISYSIHISIPSHVLLTLTTHFQNEFYNFDEVFVGGPVAPHPFGPLTPTNDVALCRDETLLKHACDVIHFTPKCFKTYHHLS